MLLDFLFKRQREIDISVLSEQYPAIRVTNLQKQFKKRVKGPGSKKKENRIITALDGVSFTAHRGQIFGLLGPNSSGKTTALRCMATLCQPDAGSVHFYGIDVLKNQYTARQMLGFVAQSAGLDKTLTGREHLELFASLAHLERGERRQMIDMLIDVLGLGDFIDRLTAVYSGGVIRRLDMAIALLHRPPILILDEPTVGLDIESRQVIWQVLQHLRAEGATIVLTSHYLEEVDVLSDEVAIMDNGVMLAQGPPTKLKDSLGGDRISIRINEFTESDEAQMACNILKKKGLAREALINRMRNNTIELVVDPGNARIGGEIVAALSDNGFEKLFSFSQSKPSLDDVYLAATGRSIADADQFARQTRTEKSMRQETMR